MARRSSWSWTALRAMSWPALAGVAVLGGLVALVAWVGVAYAWIRYRAAAVDTVWPWFRAWNGTIHFEPLTRRPQWLIWIQSWFGETTMSRPTGGQSVMNRPDVPEPDTENGTGGFFGGALEGAWDGMTFGPGGIIPGAIAGGLGVDTGAVKDEITETALSLLVGDEEAEKIVDQATEIKAEVNDRLKKLFGKDK